MDGVALAQGPAGGASDHAFQGAGHHRAIIRPFEYVFAAVHAHPAFSTSFEVDCGAPIDFLSIDSSKPGHVHLQAKGHLKVYNRLNGYEL